MDAERMDAWMLSAWMLDAWTHAERMDAERMDAWMDAHAECMDAWIVSISKNEGSLWDQFKLPHQASSCSSSPWPVWSAVALQKMGPPRCKPLHGDCSAGRGGKAKVLTKRGGSFQCPGVEGHEGECGEMRCRAHCRCAREGWIVEAPSRLEDVTDVRGSDASSTGLSLIHI